LREKKENRKLFIIQIAMDIQPTLMEHCAPDISRSTHRPHPTTLFTPRYSWVLLPPQGDYWSTYTCKVVLDRITTPERFFGPNMLNYKGMNLSK
jgi:hypothetical protein